MIRRVFAAAALSVAIVAFPAPAAETEGVGVNMEHVANVPYAEEGEYAEGTDLEFATIGGREIAFAGAYESGLRAIDITDPKKPTLLSTYDCGISQGDVQLFARDGRHYATYTADDGYSTDLESACYRDAKVPQGQRFGTFIIDVTDPRKMKAVSFMGIARGSHNTTVHPSGKFLYNSNADLENPEGLVEIVDVANLREPKVIGAIDLVTGLSSHDISFSKDGTRAYVAALTHTVILDTTDPANPTVIGRVLDPTVNIHHGADPFTVTAPNGSKRTFLIISDELAGAAGNGFCPGGGLHVYDMTGPLEALPVKVGVYLIPNISITTGESFRCTAHVMQFHEDEQLMTIAWYAAGVHVLDLSRLGLLRFSPELGELTGAGIRSVGSYVFDDSEAWAAKTNKIAPDGSFHLFANDHIRGFDVFEYTPGPRPTVGLSSPAAAGTWLTPDQVPVVDRTGYRPFCLLPPEALAA